MAQYRGKSVFGGIAIGKIKVFQKENAQVKRFHVESVEDEIERYQSAKVLAGEQLSSLYEKALKEVGEANAAIFEIHQMMLEDDDYNDSVENIIRTQQVNAEYAVAATGDNFAEMFLNMDDDYLRGRAADVKDISERMVRILSGKNTEAETQKEPAIILAKDLAPSETVQLDKDMVLAFVTTQGSTNSHTAILARTMGIPALVSTDLFSDVSEEKVDELLAKLDGKQGSVDGGKGIFYVDPTEEELSVIQKQKKKDDELKNLYDTLKGKENITEDGQKLMLYANIGNSKDLALVLKNDAGGIGLFRSEFLYLEKEDFPTEEEQFQVYKTVAETMAGKRVIIRTLDIGADKQCDYFKLEKEENPAMGMRAIRICLTRPEIFKTQLRALFRAGMYGKLAVMYPMITSVEEIHQIQSIVAEVKEELRAEEIPFAEVEQGIMIETPAAVMISDLLAKEVDFFSIGTNDLTQYSLAIDRQNAKLDSFYNPHHPGVLRMIEMVVKNAHEAGIWAGICGELGADLSLTKEFLAMGVDELSVSPARILPIRKIVLETNVTEYRKIKRSREE